MNKKEEVLDIELTPYGKYLLASGKMNPVYYAFFDDNILYDASYAGITEEQSEAQDRIRKQTPQLQTQYKFTSETNTTHEVDFGNGEKINVQAPLARNTLAYSLSKSEIANQKTPAITLTFLRGNAQSYDLTYRTPLGNKRIDQINTKLTFEYQVLSIGTLEGDLPMDMVDILEEEGENVQIFEGPVGESGQYLKIKTDYILADILEKNAEFDFENFDIEVFEVTGSNLLPLKFSNNVVKNNVVDNLLVDLPEAENEEQELTPSDVEYYFHIYCDSEIDTDILQEAAVNIKSKGFFNDDSFDYRDAPQAIKQIADIYGTNVREGDIKDCD
tara:strand:- start:3736 stop:4725 length:990 start_codon:yes stop_codon:yes gene_type:complete